MSDSDAVEGFRKSAKGDFEHTGAKPTGLDPTVGGAQDCAASYDQNDHAHLVT